MFYILTLVLVILIIKFLKILRKNTIIVVDLDALFNVDSIKQRGDIYILNKGKDKDFMKYYIEAHFNEKRLVPQNISKALHYQNLGYKLVFVSTLREYLRPKVCEFLNEWGFKGELHLTTKEDDNLILYFAKILCKIERAIGVITTEQRKDTICFGDLTKL